MKERSAWVAVPVILALVLTALPVVADGSTWLGEYYSNQWLIGVPALIHDDLTVNFNWGRGSPGTPIPADHFSVRWTRSEFFSGGDVRFYVTTDDGARLWVDSQLLIDQWHNQAPTTYEATVSLTPGTHFLRLEYYEDTGNAAIQCRWQSELSFPDWKGEYYNNAFLGGAPVLQRNDRQIDFEWGVHSPSPGVGSDDFSVRWTRTHHFDAGTYRFTATVDDGVRVWVDSQLIVDEWWVHSVRSFSRDMAMTSGDHAFRVEYYDRGSFAVARFSWEEVGATALSSGEWYGEYFNNVSLSGSPTLDRNEPSVDFAWGWGSPDWRIPSDYFSARWTTTAQFDTGRTYTFSAWSDDGVRVWVDGELVIDAWYDHSPRSFSGDRWLAAGDHQIRVEYYERAGTAEIEVRWDNAPPSPSPPLIAEVIVDEQGADFIWGGTLRSRHDVWSGHGGHAYFTYNNRYAWTNYAKWVPRLPHAGNYQIYVYIPSSHTTTERAQYRVVHDGVRHDRRINQGAYGNQWVSLGTYYFDARNGGREFVLMYDNTGEWPNSRTIGIDAVKFVVR